MDALAADGTLSQQHDFETPDDAAIEVLNVTAPLSAEYGLEIGGNIFLGEDGAWHYTLPDVGGPTGINVDDTWIGYHTHPSGKVVFSNQITNFGDSEVDSTWVRNSGNALYVGVELSNGVVGIAVCPPNNCSQIEYQGTKGRTVQ